MAQNEKNLPINVWLGEDSHWNSEPQDSKGYVGYVRKDYHAQALLHVLHKGVEQGKKEMLDKACNWLYEYCRYGCCEYIEKNDFINDFKKAMEE